MLSSNCSTGHRDRGAVLRDDRAVLQERPLVVVGLQQRRTARRRRCGWRRPPWCRPGSLSAPGLDGQDDADAVVDQLHVADPADRDAAVGDLGVDEDAAGVLEVGGDVVAAAQEQPVQADVLEAEVGHAEHAPPPRRRAAGAWSVRVITAGTPGSCGQADGAGLRRSAPGTWPTMSPGRPGRLEVGRRLADPPPDAAALVAGRACRPGRTCRSATSCGSQHLQRAGRRVDHVPAQGLGQVQLDRRRHVREQRVPAGALVLPVVQRRGPPLPAPMTELAGNG